MNNELELFMQIDEEQTQAHLREVTNVIIRLSKHHPWYHNLPYKASVIVNEFGDYYFTRDETVIISGEPYRELKFPFASYAGMAKSHIEKLKKMATEFRLMSWIKYKKESHE